MKKDFEETSFHIDSGFGRPDRGDTDFAETTFGLVAKRRNSKRRMQKWVGILMLLAGYMSLAVTPDSDSDWLLIRVVGGFALLFTGFAVAISPIVASILGDHD